MLLLLGLFFYLLYIYGRTIDRLSLLQPTKKKIIIIFFNTLEDG